MDIKNYYVPLCTLHKLTYSLISINTVYQVGLFNVDAVIKIKENYDQCQYLDTLRKLEDSKIPRY